MYKEIKTSTASLEREIDRMLNGGLFDNLEDKFSECFLGGNGEDYYKYDLLTDFYDTLKDLKTIICEYNLKIKKWDYI